MKLLLILCGTFLFLAVTHLPVGFYTLLRILVTIGTIYIICAEVQKGITISTILFGLIAILFNPLLPIYLLDKSAWVPFDLISGIIFLIKAFLVNGKLKHEKAKLDRF
jgi:hypothetical protein